MYFSYEKLNHNSYQLGKILLIWKNQTIVFTNCGKTLPTTDAE
jgi:hypothetical protein